MRLLVVSHSCAQPLNQQVYAEIGQRTGWEITLVVPDRWRDEYGNVLAGAPFAGLERAVRRVPVWGNGKIIFHVYRLRWQRWLRERKFDAIYVNHEPYALATAQVCRANAGSLRVPFGFYSCQNIAKRYPPPFSWLENMVYRESAFAFPITAAVGEVLRAKGFRGRNEVCALPFDPAIYRPRPRGERPEALAAAGDAPLIGYVGRIVPEKGLRTLLLALRELKDLPWQLVMVGAGPFESEFDSTAQEFGLAERIIRTGYVPHSEAPLYLAAFDLLVVPSETQPNWKEQFGRVLTEAWGCGVPVVGSDSGEIPNLVRQSGGGLVFPERQPTALAEALRRMLTDAHLRRELARQGHAWAVANVSVGGVAEKMIAVFAAVTGEKSGTAGTRKAETVPTKHFSETTQ